MELSKRLEAVAGLIEKGDKPADIGCDHGYVSIYLVKNKICTSMIAMDVNEGPLLCARENIEKECLTAYIETRLSDGAEALLEDEADTLICAGMGGRLVIHIVTEAFKHLSCIKALVLQPQSEIWLVRQFLLEQGFLIVKEDMVFEEGKYYPMMRAVKQEKGFCMTYRDEEAYYGPLLLKNRNPVLYEYLIKEKHAITRTIQQLAAAAAEEGMERRLERKEQLTKKLECIETSLALF